MNQSAVRFGTDGWRAVIADEFTFENLRAVSSALALYLKQTHAKKWKRGIVIGYDTRFMARDFAEAVAQTVAAQGIPARVSNRDCPTPAIAWTVRNEGLACGIILTASHNPPRYSGFKFVEPDGSPADKAATDAVQALLGQTSRGSGVTGAFEELAQAMQTSRTRGTAAPVTEFDPRPAFLQQLHNVIDFDLLKKAKGKAVCDFVHGSGRGYLDDLLRECGWKVETLRAGPDPMFGGILPDPANPKCHDRLQEVVQRSKAHLGLANDPDADRFGVVDTTGDYITPNQVLCLAYLHLLEHRGLSGPVARTVATTGLLDDIAAAHGQDVIETPVGFKWLGDAIEDQGAILGGEESGGLSIAGHTPGKDGVLADLLMAEVWAVHRKPLGEVYEDILKKYGKYYSQRVDVRLDGKAKDRLMEKMSQKPPASIAGSKVKEVVRLDGVKLKLEDDSWLLMRPSGTEPLVRVYMEARTKKRLKELESAAQKLS